jgi:ketosteroid isomerase-like protein
MSATATEREAITATLQLYIDGAADGDLEKLRRAFHDDAWMFGQMGGQRLDMPIAQFFDLAASKPLRTDDSFHAEISSVEQAGDIACAVVTEEGAWGGVSFTDHFTLAEIDGEWKIVNKTFTHTGGEPPAS